METRGESERGKSDGKERKTTEKWDVGSVESKWKGIEKQKKRTKSKSGWRCNTNGVATKWIWENFVNINICSIEKEKV